MSATLIWSFPHSVRVYEVERSCASPAPGLSQAWTEYQVRRGRKVAGRFDTRTEARTDARRQSDALQAGFDDDDKPAAANILEANAHLIAAAPAMALVLDLLRLKLARFEPGEFCFNGLCYSISLPNDWVALIDVIGWDSARAAIAKAYGETP